MSEKSSTEYILIALVVVSLLFSALSYSSISTIAKNTKDLSALSDSIDELSTDFSEGISDISSGIDGVLTKLGEEVEPDEPDEPVEPDEPDEPVTIVWGTSIKYEGLGPATLRTTPGYFTQATMEHLVKIDIDGNLVPNLATRWEVIDASTYEFWLRDDVYFHDGTKFNASCVAFSWNRTAQMYAQRARGTGWYIYRYVKDYPEGVEILGDYHIRVHLKDPWGEWLKVCAYHTYGIVSPTAALKLGEEGYTYEEGGNIGTGPLKFLYWIPEEEAVYERWDDYVGTQPMPKYDKLVIKFFRDAATLRLAIEAGSIDLAFHFVAEADVPDLMNNPDLGYVRFPHPAVSMLMMSMDPRWEYTSDPLVREAIAYCVNYDALITLFNAKRSYGLLNENIWPEYNLGLQNKYYYDPDKAKELLALAGYPDGLPEPIEFWYDPRGWGATEEASILIEGLNAAGIEVKVTTSDVLNKRWLDRAIQMAPHVHTTTVEAASYVMDANYRSSTLNAFRSSFNSTEVDALLAEGRATLDEKERIELYHKIQRLSDAPPSHQIYLYRGWDTAFYRKDTMKPIPMGPYNGALTAITTDVLLWEPVS